jgi:protein Mpv17
VSDADVDLARPRSGGGAFLKVVPSKAVGTFSTFSTPLLVRSPAVSLGSNPRQQSEIIETMCRRLTTLILCLAAVQVQSLLAPSPAGRSYVMARASVLRAPLKQHVAHADSQHLEGASGSSWPEGSASVPTAASKRRRPLGPLLLLPVALLAPLYARRAFTGATWLWAAYEAAAISRPLITKSATSGVAYFLGDAIAQGQTQTRADATDLKPWWRGIDLGRLTSATVAGALSHGPQLHYWTLILERSGLPLLGKVALDQTVFSLYLNAAFCVSTELMRRRPLRAALAKARAAARPCLVAGWKFWPFAHALTYSVVPLHLRVLWVDVLEVAWVAILSKTVARSKASASASAAAAEAAGAAGAAPNAEDEAAAAGVAPVLATVAEVEADLRCDHILACELPPLEEMDGEAAEEEREEQLAA